MRAALVIAAAAAAAIVTSGCMARVALPPAPSPHAPLAERRQALKDYSGRLSSAEGARGEPVERDGIPTGQLTDYLQLGNGLRVEDPRDLLPWVEERSRTASYTTAFEISQSRASVLGTAAVVAPVLGIGAFAASVFVPSMRGPRFSANDSIPFTIGAGVGSVLGMGFLIAALVFNGTAAVERENAFGTYPSDLAYRLALEEQPPAIEAVP